MTVLIAATDADFDWMLGGALPEGRRLRLPPDGVDDAAVLSVVRQMTRALHQAGCNGSWMIVSDDEVVGLCSYMRPPSGGHVDVGYGIAPSRRGAGHATRAVAALLDAAADDADISVIGAQTAVENVASRRVLEKNGFEKAGERTDPEDGKLIVWTKVL